jgi:cold shock CspA family protein/ribosome-associated translation inhibitor RaiA
MQLAPIISFHGLEPSPALETDIRERIDRLETYCPSMIGCRVSVEFVQRHHETGNRFHVRIDLTVPGEELVVTHEANLHASAQGSGAERVGRLAEPNPERKHAHVAVREAFDVARRQLQDYARRHRGAVKVRTETPRGRVSQLYPVDEYGYIEAADGHEIYFQKSSVLKDAFEQLQVGSTVSYREEPGEKGPQASTVQLLHPHRSRRTHRAA